MSTMTYELLTSFGSPLGSPARRSGKTLTSRSALGLLPAGATATGSVRVTGGGRAHGR
ncbi:hypothetical protein [Streptomyces sp. H27-C3]|uniref:hypothetical protein n=1 Tax=Streptomyces sp. H27-C3 TaxID=3046305 RepID=UPI0024BB1857|nr:hypothetical protein [Streptomyces sp. H27-C3]MDJ0463744.1 hypothetical protein [Streptomyces sp. H27-C3]